MHVVHAAPVGEHNGGVVNFCSEKGARGFGKHGGYRPTGQAELWKLSRCIPDSPSGYASIWSGRGTSPYCDAKRKNSAHVINAQKLTAGPAILFPVARPSPRTLRHPACALVVEHHEDVVAAASSVPERLAGRVQVVLLHPALGLQVRAHIKHGIAPTVLVDIQTLQKKPAASFEGARSLRPLWFQACAHVPTLRYMYVPCCARE